MSKKNVNRRSNRLWRGADLVVEVVSPTSGERDYQAKVAEYTTAGVPEYWIVDPQKRRITVLALKDGAYVEHCVAGAGEEAASALLDGFKVAADNVFSRE